MVEVDGRCYDPTFKVVSFIFANPPHIDWYALDEEERGVDKSVAAAWQIYLKLIDIRS